MKGKIMSIIDDLKANEKPFGLMSEEMQDKAKEIGPNEFLHYLGDSLSEVSWDRLEPTLTDFDAFVTSKLRPDYAPKPETVECEVYVEECNGNICPTIMFKTDSGGDKGWYLHEAPDHPYFIGFKYDDGTTAVHARLYKCDETNQIFTSSVQDILNHYEVLTPTHVLFGKVSK